METYYKHIAMLGRAYGLRYMHNEGHTTYGHVFSSRHPEDRYAILYDVQRKYYLCVDMADTHWIPDSLAILLPSSPIFPTEDAAVMAARLKL